MMIVFWPLNGNLLFALDTNRGHFLVQWDIGLKFTTLLAPGTGKERGDIEIKDYVVMQKPQVDRLPPPHTLIMDYTMTHVQFGRSHLHPMDQLTNTRRSDGVPDPDEGFKEVTRIKIRHYRNLYLNRPTDE